MKLRLIVLGAKAASWVREASDDYVRRLPRTVSLEIVELKPEPRDRGVAVEQLLAAEARRVLAIVQDAWLVALDERGLAWTTAQFASALAGWRDEAQEVAFVIGSADGLAISLREKARVVLSLSAMTLPHALARVVLIEQIYRATSLLSGHPYHRE